MPTYAFRCPTCGPFDRRLSMSAVTDTVDCPTCGGVARRLITAPALTAGGHAHAVAAAHERSAHAPDVVTSVPAGRVPGAPPPVRTPVDPRHARLPKP